MCCISTYFLPIRAHIFCHTLLVKEHNPAQKQKKQGQHMFLGLFHAGSYQELNLADKAIVQNAVYLRLAQAACIFQPSFFLSHPKPKHPFTSSFGCICCKLH